VWMEWMHGQDRPTDVSSDPNGSAGAGVPLPQHSYQLACSSDDHPRAPDAAAAGRGGSLPCY